MHLSRCVVCPIMPFYVRKMIEHEARTAVLKLIRRGLVTVPEAAQLAGVSRQLIRHWCKRAHIVIGKSRHARIAKEWRKVLDRPD